MLVELFGRLQSGSDMQKAVFVMVAGVLGVFLVLAVFFGLIHLLRRVLKK